jgi:hypothetical protein
MHFIEDFAQATQLGGARLRHWCYRRPTTPDELERHRQYLMTAGCNNVRFQANPATKCWPGMRAYGKEWPTADSTPSAIPAVALVAG